MSVLARARATPAHARTVDPGPEAAAPARPPRFPAFDGLRAIAALTVVGVHVAFSSGITPKGGVGVYTARLEIGVAVFFLISGFLLYRPFAVAHLAAAPPPRTGAFWVRRLLRIVPLYWTVLFLSITVLNTGRGMGPGGWKGYLTHYLFAQIYFPNQVFYGLGQAWSLCVEMSFYLVLPFYALFIGRRRLQQSDSQRLRVELLGLVALTAVSFAWRGYVLANQRGGSSDVFHVATTWLPAYLDLFSLGMLLAVLSAWSHHHRRELRLFSRWWFPWLSWLCAGVCFWAVSHIGIPLAPVYTASELDLAKQTLYGLFAFFLLLPAVFGPSRRGLVRQFLCSWPMASLGVISYGIYLWHETWIFQILKVGHFHLFQVEFWAYFCAVVALSIVASTLTYFVVEKPALRLKNSLSWWRRRADARAGPGTLAPEQGHQGLGPQHQDGQPRQGVGRREVGRPVDVGGVAVGDLLLNHVDAGRHEQTD